MKLEPQLITVRKAEQADKLPYWLVVVGKAAYWLSVALFVKASIDAVG